MINVDVNGYWLIRVIKKCFFYGLYKKKDIKDILLIIRIIWYGYVGKLVNVFWEKCFVFLL